MARDYSTAHVLRRRHLSARVLRHLSQVAVVVAPAEGVCRAEQLSAPLQPWARVRLGLHREAGGCLPGYHRVVPRCGAPGGDVRDTCCPLRPGLAYPWLHLSITWLVSLASGPDPAARDRAQSIAS